MTELELADLSKEFKEKLVFEVTLPWLYRSQLGIKVGEKARKRSAKQDHRITL